jgi:endogenous inhibitor of DNA gyrase (YacG/DUF329 family)
MAETLPFDVPDHGAKPCPICGKPSVPLAAPFCSKRCANVDLHRWLGGVYAVPDDEPGQPDLSPDDEG